MSAQDMLTSGDIHKYRRVLNGAVYYHATHHAPRAQRRDKLTLYYEADDN